MNKNKTPHLPEDLEKELQDYYASPEPQPEFVSRLERGLHSKFNEQEKTKMFAKSAKLKWGLGFAIAAVLIGLLVTSPTVVAAMKRLLSYIPGVGLVDSASPFRVLAEPVSQTRDGVTITVKEMVLSSDKTAIVYTMENIPFDTLSQPESNPGCSGAGEVRLPDGRLLQQNAGSATGWGTGMEMRFTYAPVPADVNEATLFIKCIQGTLPGALPENWELPLHFIPAPPDMTVVPVIEVTPSQDAGAVSSNPMVLEKVIETDTGYILIGKFNSTRLPEDFNITNISGWPKITDANGQEIAFTTPHDLDTPMTEARVYPWAYQLDGKQFAWPLTITQESADRELPGAQTSFEFDTGLNPKAGQEWVLDKQIQLGEYAVTLTSIIFNGDGYTFKFHYSDEVNVNMSVEIAGSSPAGGGGGGDGDINFASMSFEGAPPVGKLPLVFSSHPIVQIRGPWQLQWQPEDTSSMNLPAPTEAPQACLTTDSWQSALSNPKPIPADLTGKASVYGRIIEDGQNPSPDNFGVYVSSLDGSNKQIVGKGTWPSLSPDGTQVAYAQDDGLHIFDLASGADNRIPNTLKDDNVPRWSSDGKQIAFMRVKDFNLYIINSDGSGVKQVLNGIDYEELIGWSSDGASLFYGVNTQDGVLLNQVDIASGTTQKLFTIKSSSGMEVSLSPDGTHFAFMDQSGSVLSFGIYTAALDGSDRKLIAQSGRWLVMRPIWSPDGKWLLMGILNTDNSAPETVSAAVNLQTCQIAPLPLSGDVSSWVP